MIRTTSRKGDADEIWKSEKFSNQNTKYLAETIILTKYAHCLCSNLKKKSF